MWEGAELGASSKPWEVPSPCSLFSLQPLQVKLELTFLLLNLNFARQLSPSAQMTLVLHQQPGLPWRESVQD